jgi:hypothetical protein
VTHTPARLDLLKTKSISEDALWRCTLQRPADWPAMGPRSCLDAGNVTAADLRRYRVDRAEPTGRVDFFLMSLSGEIGCHRRLNPPERVAGAPRRGGHSRGVLVSKSAISDAVVAPHLPHHRRVVPQHVASHDNCRGLRPTLTASAVADAADPGRGALEPWRDLTRRSAPGTPTLRDRRVRRRATPAPADLELDPISC